MRVRFWGTRGSIAKPGPSTVRYGGNTSCVEVRSATGTIIVLDCGTGAHGLGQSLLQEGLTPCSGHIFISHTHWDHIQGIPFFAPLFCAGNEWHIYGPRGLGQSLRDVLAGQMEYTYFPVSLDQFAATIHYHDVVEGTFNIGEMRIVARYLNHPALTMGYRLETDGAVVVYSTDHEPHAQDLALGTACALHGEDMAHQHFVQGADLLIHDAQYTGAEYASKIGWGHSTVEYATDMALAARVKRLALYHHDPTRDDEGVDRLLDTALQRVADAGGSVEIFGAMEGSIIELESALDSRCVSLDTSATGLLDPTNDLSKAKVLIAVADKADRAILAAATDADDIAAVQMVEAKGLLEAVDRNWPSLIFLGDDLPHTDPLELCQSIRALPHQRAESTPLIVVTDEALVDTAKGQLAGVTDWLTRPFSMQYARTRTRAWLIRTMCRWVKAPLPADEECRIKALHDLDILDTDAEERFDRYTRITATAFNAPIALVSLVDRHRQWFKSRHGLDASETPRDMAFCAHAIHDDDALIVPDALQDERFADNPLVADDPRIRFYAGVPLRVAGGNRIGTLCVIDHRPRDLSPSQVELLKEIAELVELELASKDSDEIQ
jgi:phosphoribosyl 1,2-cyclic phosphodiesterase/DNA-binding response OmpR family regulator